MHPTNHYYRMVPIFTRRWNVYSIQKAGIHHSPVSLSTNMKLDHGQSFPDADNNNTKENKDYSRTKNNMSTEIIPVTSTKPLFVLILGKPGGGKGTISGKILNDFPVFHHLSTGDLLRTHVRNKTELGVQAKKFMDTGALVPDDLIIDLVMNEASQAVINKRSLLLDGFPRNIDQAVSLDKKVKVDMVVNLNVPTDTIVERIADRWIHPASGRVYNYSYNPPLVHGKDNQTGEDLIQREDDKPETVRRRLNAYDKVTVPLVNYYEAFGVLRTFSGTMSDLIYPDIKRWLELQFNRS